MPLQVLEGSEFVEERNDTEQKKLKKVNRKWSTPLCTSLSHSAVHAACLAGLGASVSKITGLSVMQKPATHRLACQLNVGDGENSGVLRIRTKPK